MKQSTLFLSLACAATVLGIGSLCACAMQEAPSDLRAGGGVSDTPESGTLRNWDWPSADSKDISACTADDLVKAQAMIAQEKEWRDFIDAIISSPELRFSAGWKLIRDDLVHYYTVVDVAGPWLEDASKRLPDVADASYVVAWINAHKPTLPERRRILVEAIRTEVLHGHKVGAGK